MRLAATGREGQEVRALSHSLQQHMSKRLASLHALEVGLEVAEALEVGGAPAGWSPGGSPSTEDLGAGPTTDALSETAEEFPTTDALT